MKRDLFLEQRDVFVDGLEKVAFAASRGSSVSFSIAFLVSMAVVRLLDVSQAFPGFVEKVCDSGM